MSLLTIMERNLLTILVHSFESAGRSEFALIFSFLHSNLCIADVCAFFCSHGIGLCFKWLIVFMFCKLVSFVSFWLIRLKFIFMNKVCSISLFVINGLYLIAFIVMILLISLCSCCQGIIYFFSNNVLLCVHFCSSGIVIFFLGSFFYNIQSKHNVVRYCHCVDSIS